MPGLCTTHAIRSATHRHEYVLIRDAPSQCRSPDHRKITQDHVVSTVAEAARQHRATRLSTRVRTAAARRAGGARWRRGRRSALPRPGRARRRPSRRRARPPASASCGAAARYPARARGGRSRRVRATAGSPPCSAARRTPRAPAPRSRSRRRSERRLSSSPAATAATERTRAHSPRRYALSCGDAGSLRSIAHGRPPPPSPPRSTAVAARSSEARASFRDPPSHQALDSWVLLGGVTGGPVQVRFRAAEWLCPARILQGVGEPGSIEVYLVAEGRD